MGEAKLCTYYAAFGTEREEGEGLESCRRWAHGKGRGVGGRSHHQKSSSKRAKSLKASNEKKDGGLVGWAANVWVACVCGVGKPAFDGAPQAGGARPLHATASYKGPTMVAEVLLVLLFLSNFLFPWL